MEIKDRKELVNSAISRVINNAPISEILRVYSMAVQTELEKLSDTELVNSVLGAGYMDLIEKHVEGELDELIDDVE